MKNPITNYGKLLAEIQYFEGVGNDFQVERLSKLLDAARVKDRKNEVTGCTDAVSIEESGPSKD
jgi:hypothetical protein